jgi:hypothetical protein
MPPLVLPRASLPPLAPLAAPRQQLVHSFVTPPNSARGGSGGGGSGGELGGGNYSGLRDASDGSVLLLRSACRALEPLARNRDNRPALRAKGRPR